MQAEIETAPASERGDTVKGEIAFARRSADEGGRPGVPPRGYGELPVVNHEVTIRNVRPIADKLSLDREGFLVIRHQVRGCHSWSLNGGPFKAGQSITLRHGGTLGVTDNDLMSHTLVLTSGPSLRIAHPTLGHPGATLKITFTKPGVYHFTTKAGEDYMAGVKTIGEDNVLKLTVTVP